MANIENYMRKGRVFLSLLSSAVYLAKSIARITQDYYPGFTKADDAILESEISEKLRMISTGIDAITLKEDDKEKRLSDLMDARRLLEEFNNEYDSPAGAWGGRRSAFSPLILEDIDDSDYGTDDEL